MTHFVKRSEDILMAVKKENTRYSVTLRPEDKEKLSYLKNNSNMTFSKNIRKLIQQEFELEKAGFNGSLTNKEHHQ